MQGRVPGLRHHLLVLLAATLRTTALPHTPWHHLETHPPTHTPHPPPGAPDANEVLNERAVAVMKRMSDKLTGRDFTPSDGMPGSAEPDSVQQQVQRLIQQATSDENLCQSYIGW